MKRGLVLIVFLSLSFSQLAAQVRFEEKYFQNGKIKDKGKFSSQGYKDSIWIEGEYDDGSYSYQVGNYDLGVKEGIWKYYDDKGTLLFTELYKGGSLQHYEGWNIEYNNKGGIYSKEKYVNGKMDSLWVTYYDNGNKSSEIDYVNDHYCGRYNEYYSSGKIKTEGHYELRYMLNSEMPRIVFNNSSRIDTGVLFYDEDSIEIKTGIWREYYENGQIDSMGSYFPCHYRVLDGPDTVPDEDNNLAIVKREYEFDFKDGLWKFYNASGKLIRDEFWENCKLKKRDDY